MNGAEPNIEIFKPFGEAFELMKKILFQPFDLKKWFIIGFAAWLANLGRGGGSFNYQFNRREEGQKINERSEEHTSEIQSQSKIVCRLLPGKKKTIPSLTHTSS